MNTRSWMQMPDRPVHRHWVRRTRGRRSGDRAVRLEAILGAGVILAWAWGVYEVTLLFLR